MKKKVERCASEIEFSDDHGDNNTTFRCELPPKHEGPHRESGNMYMLRPYVLYWEDSEVDENVKSMKALREWAVERTNQFIDRIEKGGKDV